MKQKKTRTLSILLSLLMVLSVFGTMAFTASAATTTVTWNYSTLNNSGKGNFSKDDITLTADIEAHQSNCFYNGWSNTFTAPSGSVFTKI